MIAHLSEVGNEIGKAFRAADIEAIASHLHEYLKDFFRFACCTGRRRGSISKLRWTDITDNQILFRAKDEKSRKPGSVPIVGQLAEIIDRRRAAQVWWEDKQGNAHFSEYVFHRNGRPVGEFRRAWKNALKAANVEGFRFHDTRCTAATNMRDAGVPRSVAKTITGHHTDVMWERYNITEDEQKRDALAKTQQHVSTQTERKVVAMKGVK